MKVIVNQTDKVIVVGFDGYDYTIEPSTPVLADEKASAFLKERYPFLLVEEPPRSKQPSTIPAIHRKKTPVLIDPQKEQFPEGNDLRRIPNVSRDSTSDFDALTRNGMDRDGVEWSGEGVEQDNLTTFRKWMVKRIRTVNNDLGDPF